MAKVKVSERAVLARLNRKLRDEDLIVKKSRDGTRARADLGEYYMIDSRNHITGEWLNSLAEYAKRYGVLRAWEEIDAG